MLLADIMTFTERIMGIGRYGIAGHKHSIIARASFEETKKHLIDAAVRGIRDDLSGSVENIIMNKVAPMGTGSFTLIGKLPKIPSDIRKEYEKMEKELKEKKEVAEAERVKILEEPQAKETEEVSEEEPKEEKEKPEKEKKKVKKEEKKTVKKKAEKKKPAKKSKTVVKKKTKKPVKKTTKKTSKKVVSPKKKKKKK